MDNKRAESSGLLDKLDIFRFVVGAGATLALLGVGIAIDEIGEGSVNEKYTHFLGLAFYVNSSVIAINTVGQYLSRRIRSLYSRS